MPLRKAGPLLQQGLIVAAGLWLGYALLVFLRIYYAFFHYPYDWDPGDGDMLNVVMRIRHGLPAYLDWRQGEFTTLYTPLSHYLLAAISFFGPDPMMAARTLNVLAIVASTLLAGAIAWLAASKSGERNTLAAAVIAAFAAWTNWSLYREAMLFRPDALGLLFSMLCCLMIVLRPQRPGTVGLLAIAAVLSKQNFAPVGLGALLYYLLFNRSYLWAFIWKGTVMAGISLAGLELANEGNFLRSTLEYPGRFYEENGFLLWTHYWDNVLVFHDKHYWVAGLGLIGLLTALYQRGPLAAISLIWIVDLLLGLKSWRQIGGMRSYLWLHWFLLAVLAGYGCFMLTKWIARSRPSVSGVMPIIFAVLGIIAIRPMFELTPFGVEPQMEISQKHEATVRRLDPNGTARWVTNRFSAVVVRNGNLLRQELCSLGVAFSQERVLERKQLLQQFLNGEVDFFQTGPGLAINGLQEVLDACFSVAANSQVNFAGGPYDIQILRYDNTRPECERLIASTASSKSAQ